MAPQKEWPRLSFQESMELSRLPEETSESGTTVQKFMSRQPAWVVGNELPWDTVGLGEKKLTKGAFGGVIYAQAPLAASRVVEQEDKESGNADENSRRGIHSIQAVFTNPGVSDRPFILEVSTIHSSRSFSTRLVNARQSIEPSSVPSGPFPLSDAQAPLGSICFTCTTTFKRPVPGPADIQDVNSPQKRYESILSSRLPTDWDPAPQADIDAVKASFPNPGHGAFPILDMFKVNMTSFNEGKHIPDRRELILYRLLKPLPKDDVNAHILCHAFEADRNGLIMLGNHLGYGFDLGAVCSLSYSFYVHVNADEAVMTGDGFWIQEVLWPRVSAGRGMMECRIWSPEGKHVATAYQDGIILPTSRAPKPIMKL
ncbi:Fc.00g001530.m01.CDS01 [Cosmosporella sp. VM-42]